MVDDEMVKVYKTSELEVGEWTDMWMCVDVPFNARQESDTAAVLCMLFRKNSVRKWKAI